MTLGGRGGGGGGVGVVLRKTLAHLSQRFIPDPLSETNPTKTGLRNYAAVSLKKILHNPPTSPSSPSLIPANKTFLAAFFFSRKEKKTSSLFTMQLFNKVT